MSKQSDKWDGPNIRIIIDEERSRREYRLLIGGATLLPDLLCLLAEVVRGAGYVPDGEHLMFYDP